MRFLSVESKFAKLLMSLCECKSVVLQTLHHSSVLWRNSPVIFWLKHIDKSSTSKCKFLELPMLALKLTKVIFAIKCQFFLNLCIIILESLEIIPQYFWFDCSYESSSNLYFDRLILLKLYKSSAKKVLTSYISRHWKERQSSRKN